MRPAAETERRFGVVYTEPDQVTLMVRLALAEHLARAHPPHRRLIYPWVLAAPGVAGGARKALVGAGGMTGLGATLAGLQLVDPAVGDGAFLLGAFSVLRQLLQEAGLDPPPEAIAGRLCGADRDAGALDRLEQRFGELLPEGADGPRLCHGDSLAPPGGFGVDWKSSFPRVFQQGGFQLVLGNPPYVRQEHIGPVRTGPVPSLEERRRYRKQLRTHLAARLEDLPGPIPGRSDLYLYFFLLGLSLMAPDGVLAFITSNAWLDGNYGAYLRSYLDRRMERIVLLEDGPQPAFADADVNAVVTVLSGFRSQTPAKPVLYLERPGRAHAAGLVNALLDGPPAAGHWQGWVAKRGNGGAHWRGQLLRAPEMAHRLLATGRLVPLGTLFQVETYLNTGGANGFFFLPDGRVHRTSSEEMQVETPDGQTLPIEACFLRPLLKSSQEVDRIGVEPGHSRYWILAIPEPLAGSEAVGAYIAWGERAGFHTRSGRKGKRHWYLLPPQAYSWAPLLVGRTHHDRHAIFWNRAELVSNEFYRLHPRPEGGYDDPALAAAVLNSSVVALLAELAGRSNLGQGARKTEGTDWKQLPIPDPHWLYPRSPALKELAGQLAHRPLGNVFAEAEMPDRATLDRLVLEGLGLPPAALGTVHRALGGLVERRLQRARSRR